MAYMSKNLPSVAVASGERHEAVGKALVVDQRAELTAEVRRVTHGTVPVTNDGLSDQAGEVVIVLPADTLNGKGNVSRGEGVVTESDFGANELGSALLLSLDGLGSRGQGLVGETTKVLLGKSDKLVVGDTTSANEDHAVSSVVGLDVIDQVVPGDGLDVLLGTEDGATKGLALESGGVEVVEDNLLELLVNLLLLTQDHIPLTLNGTGLQLRVLENVCEDVDGLRDVAVERLGIVDGVFSLRKAISVLLPLYLLPESYRCVGVKVRTHVLNLELQLVLGSLVGTLTHCQQACIPRISVIYPYLESKVLEEVRSSVRLVGLCPATGIDPHTNGRGLSPWRVLSRNLVPHISILANQLETISRVINAYRKAVREGGGLGGGGQGNRRSKTPSHRLDGVDSLATPKSLLEAVC